MLKVHWARLKNGEEVAVKIQYPGLRNSIFADLSVLIFLSKLAGVLFPSYHLGWVFNELSGNLSKEVDFFTEIENAEILRKKLERRTDVRYAPLQIPQKVQLCGEEFAFFQIQYLKLIMILNPGYHIYIKI